MVSVRYSEEGAMTVIRKQKKNEEQVLPPLLPSFGTGENHRKQALKRERV